MFNITKGCFPRHLNLFVWEKKGLDFIQAASQSACVFFSSPSFALFSLSPRLFLIHPFFPFLRLSLPFCFPSRLPLRLFPLPLRLGLGGSAPDMECLFALNYLFICFLICMGAEGWINGVTARGRRAHGFAINEFT